MKLLGQQSSINVRKVLWTCAELDLFPECENWGGSTRETNNPRFLQVNPKGLVPVLIDEGLVLTESNTICRYLASREGHSDLLPNDPKLRAVVESWMDWQATDLNSAWRYVFMARVREHPDFQDFEAQSRSINQWNILMSLLEAHLTKSGPYVCGDTFTLADIVLALSTNRWELTPMDHPEFPKTKEWMSVLSARPGFKKYCRTGEA